MAAIIASPNCLAASGSTAAGGTAAGAEEDVNEVDVGGGGGGCGAEAAAARVVRIATTDLEVLAREALM